MSEIENRNIVRRAPNQLGAFTPISNRLAQDSSLSFEARGLLLYLLSKPPGWICQMTDIEREGNIGRYERRRIIRECEKGGYIVRRRVNGPEGRLVWESTVYDLPPVAVLDTTLTPSVNLQSAVEPPAVEPPAGNQPPYKRESSIKERERKERERGLSLVGDLGSETPFNAAEVDGRADDLTPSLPPLAAALREALCWPEQLSPKQYHSILSAVRDLERYGAEVTPAILRRADAFYESQRPGKTWSPSFLANDWPKLKAWAAANPVRATGAAAGGTALNRVAPAAPPCPKCVNGMVSTGRMIHGITRDVPEKVPCDCARGRALAVSA